MAKIRVEVVFALADRQELRAITLPEGATVADAIAESLLAQSFLEQDFESLSVGIWGHTVTKEHVLTDGDRVEIYRDLEIDPREARRQLALLGRTMASRSSE